MAASRTLSSALRIRPPGTRFSSHKYLVGRNVRFKQKACLRIARWQDALPRLRTRQLTAALAAWSAIVRQRRSIKSRFALYLVESRVAKLRAILGAWRLRAASRSHQHGIWLAASARLQARVFAIPLTETCGCIVSYRACWSMSSCQSENFQLRGCCMYSSSWAKEVYDILLRYIAPHFGIRKGPVDVRAKVGYA